MSKSTTHVLCPRLARPVAKDAAEVVFPTPPLPEVTHTIRPRFVPLPPPMMVSTSFGWERTNGCDEELLRNRVLTILLLRDASITEDRYRGSVIVIAMLPPFYRQKKAAVALDPLNQMSSDPSANHY
mmetsp:Transcript_14179/g.20909  ORF Transcript_14179/g.20909 Transcript_14179/m.20909 type:complete len:127 (-) Transcript_14179:240-620(-)|eukprot:4010326-Ditylum_brightwellii.AAC.1